MRISDLFFFPEGGSNLGKRKAARIKCTTEESDEPQLKLIAALLNCIGRWSGSAVSAGSTVVNIASK